MEQHAGARQGQGSSGQPDVAWPVTPRAWACLLSRTGERVYRLFFGSTAARVLGLLAGGEPRPLSAPSVRQWL
eukprot:scaffold11097_cov116-Isochrysis_galbana.AAC.3